MLNKTSESLEKKGSPDIDKARFSPFNLEAPQSPSFFATRREDPQRYQHLTLKLAKLLEPNFKKALKAVVQSNLVKDFTNLYNRVLPTKDNRLMMNYLKQNSTYEAAFAFFLCLSMEQTALEAAYTMLGQDYLKMVLHATMIGDPVQVVTMAKFLQSKRSNLSFEEARDFFYKSLPYANHDVLECLWLNMKHLNASRMTNEIIGLYPAANLIPDPKNPLHIAAESGNKEGVMFAINVMKINVLEPVATLPSTDKEGWSSLHLAAKSGDQATCDYLLEKFRSIQPDFDLSLHLTSEQDNPATIAFDNGHYNLAKYLEDQSAYNLEGTEP